MKLTILNHSHSDTDAAELTCKACRGMITFSAGPLLAADSFTPHCSHSSDFHNIPLCNKSEVIYSPFAFSKHEEEGVICAGACWPPGIIVYSCTKGSVIQEKPQSRQSLELSSTISPRAEISRTRRQHKALGDYPVH